MLVHPTRRLSFWVQFHYPFWCNNPVAGLHTLAYSNGAEAFTDSLKVMQYTYLGLPIVAPEFLRSDRPHLFCYQPEDPASIRTALDGALQYDRSQVPRRSVRSWEELAQALYPDLNAVSTPSGS